MNNSAVNREHLSLISVTLGLKSVYRFHENTMNVSWNLAKHTSLEYLYYEIGEYLTQQRLFLCEKIMQTCFSGKLS